MKYNINAQEHASNTERYIHTIHTNSITDFLVLNPVDIFNDHSGVFVCLVSAGLSAALSRLGRRHCSLIRLLAEDIK